MRQLDTHVAYYTSADPWDWHAKVPAWSGVRYREPYPGVGWELSGAGGQLSSRLIARQATDLWPVRMRVQGADGVALAEDSLSLTTVLGTFALPLPLAQAADVAALPFAGMAPSLQGSDVAHPFGGANPAGSSAGGAPQAINGLEYSRLFGGNGTYVAKFQIGTPVAPTYTISGHIRTPAPNSSPVAGVTVTAGSRSTITDSDGMYRLVDLPPTQYTVRPSKAGATFAPEFQTLNLSLSLVTHSIPPKTWCDPFEPNNSLSLISPIVLGQEVKARICEDEGAPAGPDSKYRDDFYVVSVTRSAPLNITAVCKSIELSRPSPPSQPALCATLVSQFGRGGVARVPSGRDGVRASSRSTVEKIAIGSRCPINFGGRSRSK